LQQHWLLGGCRTDFLVSPGFVPEVAAYATSNHIFYAPSFMTSSEIIAAENAGITFIKLFPGNMLGSDFLSGIKDIFPKLLVPKYNPITDL
jgi:2-dehydro-3-deoxyphosphogluconate aldolase/(4S)-4-hydroxy-2-oxoglutarate aldolase